MRSQIQVAQGHALNGPEMNLPPQDRIPLYGFALQCRITTEDPQNNFVPDYGKIHTYRSPAGFGIRLDGGSAYSGAVITPYYDSLLVKTTAWGREFRHACQRMDRALREFRVRGVKTNIPFLENVVNHPQFQSGQVTTSWLADTPELFHFVQRKDRATRLLTYLSDVIVNGNHRWPVSSGRTTWARRLCRGTIRPRLHGARGNCWTRWARKNSPPGRGSRSGCYSPTRLSAMPTSSLATRVRTRRHAGYG